MRQYSKDFLFRVSVEPERGYTSFEKKKKPYYVVARNRDEAKKRLSLKSGWKVKSVSLLAEQYSNVLFGSN